MRIRRIVISNYRSIPPEGLALDLSEGLTVLVGRNNTGKTNVVQALDLVLGRGNPAYATLTEDDSHDPAQPVRVEIEMEGLDSAAVYAGASAKEITQKQAHALLNGAPSGEVTLVFHREGVEEAAEEGEAESDQADSAGSATPRFYIAKPGKAGPARSDYLGRQRNLYLFRHRLVRKVDVPAVRDPDQHLSAGRPYSAFASLLREVIESSDQREAIQQAISQTNEYLLKAFESERRVLAETARRVAAVDDAKLTLTKSGTPEELTRNLALILSIADREFDAGQIGTGTQSALIIATLELLLRRRAAAQSKPVRLFVVEEPELYLHPHATRRVGALLTELAAQSDAQVIVTTHSPAIAAAANPDSVVRLSVRGVASRPHRLAQETIDGHRQKIESELTPELAEAFFADAVVLVEGETEALLLPVLSARYAPAQGKAGDVDLDTHNVSVLATGSCSNFEVALRFLRDLEIPAFAICDADIPTKYLKSIAKAVGLSSNKDRAQLIQDLRAAGITVLSKGAIEDYYPIGLLAEIYGCGTEELQDMIEQSAKPDRAHRRNEAIRWILSKKTAEAEQASGQIPLETIERWYHEALRASEATGGNAEYTGSKSKAIKAIFADRYTPPQLGRELGRRMVERREFPEEVMTIVVEACQKASTLASVRRSTEHSCESH